MKIYGPVPSWRLGNSLGVDIVEAPPGYCKACPFNCLYCHLGHKGSVVSEPTSMELPPKDFGILEKKIIETKPEYITFSGQGEPTLNLNLGYATQRIKEMCDVPVAVLTNACFAARKDVRANLDKCDVVIAKIDAPTQQLFEKINRPANGVKLADIVDGLKLINTRVCIQTLIFSCGNVTNADNETVSALLDVYRDINKSKPIEVLLGTVTRPSDDNNLRPVHPHMLSEIAGRITKECGIKARYFSESEKEQKNHTTLVQPLLERRGLIGSAVSSPTGNSTLKGGVTTVVDIRRKISLDQLGVEITDLLLRRPCTRKEIISRFNGSEAAIVLDRLVDKGVLGLKVLNNRKGYYVVL